MDQDAGVIEDLEHKTRQQADILRSVTGATASSVKLLSAFIDAGNSHSHSNNTH